MSAWAVPSIQAVAIGHARQKSFHVQGGPAWFAGNAAFIANPADIRSCVAEHASIGLKLANQFPCVRPIIIDAIINFPILSRASIITGPAIGAIEPYFRDRAILREELP